MVLARYATNFIWPIEEALFLYTVQLACYPTWNTCGVHAVASGVEIQKRANTRRIANPGSVDFEVVGLCKMWLCGCQKGNLRNERLGVG